MLLANDSRDISFRMNENVVVDTSLLSFDKTPEFVENLYYFVQPPVEDQEVDNDDDMYLRWSMQRKEGVKETRK